MAGERFGDASAVKKFCSVSLALAKNRELLFYEDRQCMR